MAKKSKCKIGKDDYIKAVRRADRAIELEDSGGFLQVTKIHRSHKTYNRREGKRIDFGGLPFLLLVA